MAVERDFRVLGEPAKGLGRKLLRGLFLALGWGLAGLAVWYMFATMEKLEAIALTFGAFGWIGYNRLMDRLQGIFLKLDYLDRRLDDLSRRDF